VAIFALNPDLSSTKLGPCVMALLGPQREMSPKLQALAMDSANLPRYFSVGLHFAVF